MHAFHARHLAAMLAAAAFAATASGARADTAQEAAHTPSHAHDATAPARLGLDHGHKWSTDEALRLGMSRIRSLVAPQLAAARAGKLGAEQYATLAGQIEAEIGNIVAQCKLEPQADAMLHLVLADIGAGVDAMAGKTPGVRPQRGLVRVAAAVNDYGRYFDHPGFEPIRKLG